MKRVALVWLLSIAAPFVNAALRAEVDETTISAADTVRLTLRADTTNPTESPNIDALRADFDVLNTQTSSQFRSMNGRVDAWTTWAFLLKPKHTGTLLIPALNIGNEQSNAISITVRELDPQLRHTIDATVFFETTRTPDRVYVQSQLIVTRKLFYANGAQLYGEMPDIPEIPGALVRALGEPEHSTAMRDGRQFGLIEQRFAVFPERSGGLLIPKAMVSGSVRLPADAGIGGRRIGVDVSSQPLTIQVLPIPPEYPKGAPWLPATQVELLEDWPGEPERGLAVGASSQRTLIARVDGNTASAIPPLAATVPDSMKVYPESPALNEVQRAGGVVGTRTETTSLVATEPGVLTLPEVHLTWWDTVNRQTKTASVPAHTVNVTGTAPPRPTEHPDEAAGAQTAPSDASAVTHPPVAATQSEPSESNVRGWLAGFATLVLAGCGALVWWLGRRVRSPRANDPKKAEAAAYRTLVRAFSGGPHGTRAALDAWLTAHYEMPIAQATLQFTRDPNARAAIGALNAQLYQPKHDSEFDATALRRCIDARRVSAKRAGVKYDLPALYPSA